MIILWILGYLLLFLLFILALAIIVPFEYVLSGERYMYYQVQGQFMWLFRSVKLSFKKEQAQESTFSIQLFGFRKVMDIKDHDSTSSIPVKKKEKKQKKKATIEKKKKRMDWKAFLNRGLLEEAFGFIKEFMLHMAPEKLECTGDFGFEDPYHTGISCAVLSAVSPLLESYGLYLTPHFEGPKLEGRFYIKGKIQIIVLLFYACKLAFSKPVRKILFQFIKEEISYGI